MNPQVVFKVIARLASNLRADQKLRGELGELQCKLPLERFAHDSAQFRDVGVDVVAVARRAYLKAKHDHKSPAEIAAAMTKAVDDLEAVRRI